MRKFLSEYSDYETQNTSRLENPKITLDFLFTASLALDLLCDWNISKSHGLGPNSAFDIR